MVDRIDNNGFYDLVQRIHKKVDYPYTNENLEAITGTLDIKPDDKIIAICGSGAQPLALLQYLTNTGEILAVDSNKFQIRLAKEILDSIPAYFYGHNKIKISPRNEEYFSDIQRLEQIYSNRRKIDFKIMDVSKPSEISKIGRKFTKGYFSNAEVNIIAFASCFESDSLMYLTSFPFKNLLGEQINEKTIEGTFTIDQEKTRLAKEIECTNTILIAPDGAKGHWEWRPTVLRKL